MSSGVGATSFARPAEAATSSPAKQSWPRWPTPGSASAKYACLHAGAAWQRPDRRERLASVRRRLRGARRHPSACSVRPRCTWAGSPWRAACTTWCCAWVASLRTRTATARGGRIDALAGAAGDYMRVSGATEEQPRARRGEESRPRRRESAGAHHDPVEAREVLDGELLAWPLRGAMVAAPRRVRRPSSCPRPSTAGVAARAPRACSPRRSCARTGPTRSRRGPRRPHLLRGGWNRTREHRLRGDRPPHGGGRAAPPTRRSSSRPTARGLRWSTAASPRSAGSCR